MRSITSKSNQLIKKLSQLGKNKDTENFFVEGARFVRSALEYGKAVPQFLVCAESSVEAAVEFERDFDLSAYVLPDKLFAEIADTEHSQGLLGVYRRADFCTHLRGGAGEGSSGISGGNVINGGLRCGCEFEGENQKGGFCGDVRRHPVTLVLDEVRDPGNVGAMVRTADAAGFADIFVVKGSADPYSPKAARASAGSILNIRIHIGARAEILDFLKRGEYNILVTAIGGDDFRSVRLQGGSAYALVLGNEARGVHSDFLDAADGRVGIPMYGGAESLNVAVAAGILIYHFRGYDEGKNK